ncbi:MAG: hypothetical protein Q9207_003881 [Kuettlingeria erythrocarpa]
MLFTVRLGQGAVVLPRDVKRIHLDFAFRFNDGHFGARKVWRSFLPRLKYHNPAVSMTINRSQDNTGPATLTIFYGAPKDAAPSPSTTRDASTSDLKPFDRTETIDMKNKHESDILSELMDLTKPTPVVATPEDEAELQQLVDERNRGAADRVCNAAYTEQKRQEKALLDQARGTVGPA